MTKLNQVIAIEKGVKSRSHSEVTELHKINQKPDLFNGFDKTYQPKNEEGEGLPSENKRVQFEGRSVLERLRKAKTDLMDVTARKDWTNCAAKADVRVEGAVLLSQVPVSHLLFLEKELTDIRTFIVNLPVLSEADTWLKDENSALYKTAAVSTHRTQKVQKPLVLYQATENHPAQTQLITEDVIVGFWNTVKMSGAMPKPRVELLLERVETLIRSVKEAREAANMTDAVETPNVGENIFGYLLKE